MYMLAAARYMEITKKPITPSTAMGTPSNGAPDTATATPTTDDHNCKKDPPDDEQTVSQGHLGPMVP